jgi:hypothetical protein
MSENEKEEMQEEPRRGEYITSQGKKIRIVGLSPFLIDKMRASGDIPEPPTYIVETVAGDEEIHTHDETTLEVEGDPEQTKANQKAWREFVEASELAQREVNERFLRLLLLRGIDLDIEDYERGDWVKEQRSLGIDIPEDPVEKKVHYVQTEILSSFDDVINLLTRVMSLSGLDEEAMATAEASFRSAIRNVTATAAEAATRAMETQ